MNTLTLFFLKIKYIFSHDHAACFICGKFLHFHTAENFLHTGDQRGKQLPSAGLQALYSKPAGFTKRKMHEVQFDIELALSGRFHLVQ